MPFLTSVEEIQGHQPDQTEYDGGNPDSDSEDIPAMSDRKGVAVGRSNEDDSPEVEISASQKMFSAVSGSILTSLIGIPLH